VASRWRRWTQPLAGYGEIKNGEPQCKDEEEYAVFKHSQSLEPEDVWMMKVCTKVFGIGVVAEGFDVERHDETEMSTARLDLSNAPNDMGEHGSTVIFRDISEDGEHHSGRILKDHIPKTLPYDLALRINKDGNMPQVRFNEDGQWHDFAPEGGTGLKAGPWFPYLFLCDGARLSDQRVTSQASQGLRNEQVPGPFNCACFW
jgi:hypothetical protein